MSIKEIILQIAYGDSFEVYNRYCNSPTHPSLLLESRLENHAYSRDNLIAVTQAIKLTGKNEHFKIEALTDVGREVLNYLENEFSYAVDIKRGPNSIEGQVIRVFDSDLTENERIRQSNVSRIIRTTISRFKSINYRFAGLYGAFAYDFARNFERFGQRFAEGGTDDFTLFLPSNIIRIDGRRECAEHFKLEINGKTDEISQKKDQPKQIFKPFPFQEYEDISLEEYASHVEFVKEEIRKGRLMQCVISRNYGMSLQKSPKDSYEQLRKINPSPYCFYFDFGNNEFLYGASPELHVKVEGSEIEIRPIAGTAKKGKDAYENFLARRELMNDPKELAEHTMLVDLARNDLYRISLPDSIITTDFGITEEYPNLYHLVTGVRGRLAAGVDSIDALLTTLPAGTLSGAPKREAMKLIEELDGSRRNYYGGAIGYLCFNGNCNTGITIRSTHVKDNFSYVRSGGGIVIHSKPENEVTEIQMKAEKAKAVLRSKNNV